MALIAFGSAKASPGVTTTVAALAATWPDERALLVAELDPSGGDLASRFALRPDPGLVSLAAAGRRDLSPDVVLAHTQALPAVGGQLLEHRRALVAPAAADQAHACLVAIRARLAPTLAALDGTDVLVDCGRLDPGSPALGLLVVADLVVVVVRPVVGEIEHLRARVAALGLTAAGVVTIGERPYPVREVADVVGTDALVSLPDDARAASALRGEHPDGVRVLRRSRLVRAAASLAEALANLRGEGPPAVVEVRAGPEPAPALSAAPAPPPDRRSWSVPARSPDRAVGASAPVPRGDGGR